MVVLACSRLNHYANMANLKTGALMVTRFVMCFGLGLCTVSSGLWQSWYRFRLRFGSAFRLTVGNALT